MVHKWKVILAFAVIYLVWGTTYLAILFVIRDIPPFLMSGMRFLFAGIIVYLISVLKKEPQPNLTSLRRNSLQGILMLVGGTGSVALAEQYLPSSTAATIVTAVPFYFILLDYKQWKSNFSNKILLIGLLIGFVGVVLLMNLSKGSFSNGVSSVHRITGIIVLIVGGIMWTAGSLVSKYRPAGKSLLMNTAVQLLVAGIFCLCTGVFTGESKHFSFSQVHRNAGLGLAYLVIFGSVVAYACYLWLLKTKPATQVSSYVYVNPIVAVILGGIVGKESISMLHIFSLAIILCGVLLINLPKYNLQKAKQLLVG